MGRSSLTQNSRVRRAGVLLLLGVGLLAWVGHSRPRWARPVLPRPSRATCSSSPSTRCAPIGWAATATRAAQTPRLDALAARGPALRAGHHRRAADPARPLVAHDRHVPGLARRARQRRLLPRRRAGHAGRGAARARATAPAASWRSFVLDRRWGIAQGFERFFDEFDLEKFDKAPGMDAIQRPGAEVVDKAVEWLAADRERPFFAWVHLYDPHTPYEAPEPFRSRFPRTPAGRLRRRDRGHRRPGRPAARRARARRAARRDAGRRARRPRRDARRARRADPRLLHLRRRRAHPADRGRARRAARA